MTLFDDNLIFIDEIQRRFPDKSIRQNFDTFLALKPQDRPALAQQKLDMLPRSGYVERGLDKDKAETVGQHVRGMKAASKELTEAGFPVRRLNTIIDAHDTAEAIVGDFMPNETDIDGNPLSKEDKLLLEKIAIYVIYEAEPDMIKAWEEYAYGSSLTAKMVKDLDKLQMWDQSEIYKKEHPHLVKQDGTSNFQDLIDSVASRTGSSFSSINTQIMFNKRKALYANLA